MVASKRSRRAGLTKHRVEDMDFTDLTLHHTLMAQEQDSTGSRSKGDTSTDPTSDFSGLEDLSPVAHVLASSLEQTSVEETRLARRRRVPGPTVEVGDFSDLTMEGSKELVQSRKKDKSVEQSRKQDMVLEGSRSTVEQSSLEETRLAGRRTKVAAPEVAAADFSDLTMERSSGEGQERSREQDKTLERSRRQDKTLDRSRSRVEQNSMEETRLPSRRTKVAVPEVGAADFSDLTVNHGEDDIEREDDDEEEDQDQTLVADTEHTVEQTSAKDTSVDQTKMGRRQRVSAPEVVTADFSDLTLAQEDVEDTTEAAASPAGTPIGTPGRLTTHSTTTPNLGRHSPSSTTPWKTPVTFIAPKSILKETSVEELLLTPGERALGRSSDSVLLLRNRLTPLKTPLASLGKSSDSVVLARSRLTPKQREGVEDGSPEKVAKQRSQRTVTMEDFDDFEEAVEDEQPDGEAEVETEVETGAETEESERFEALRAARAQKKDDVLGHLQRAPCLTMVVEESGEASREGSRSRASKSGDGSSRPHSSLEQEVGPPAKVSDVSRRRSVYQAGSQDQGLEDSLGNVDTSRVGLPRGESTRFGGSPTTDFPPLVNSPAGATRLSRSLVSEGARKEQDRSMREQQGSSLREEGDRSQDKSLVSRREQSKSAMSREQPSETSEEHLGRSPVTTEHQNRSLREQQGSSLREQLGRSLVSREQQSKSMVTREQQYETPEELREARRSSRRMSKSLLYQTRLEGEEVAEQGTQMTPVQEEAAPPPRLSVVARFNETAVQVTPGLGAPGLEQTRAVVEESLENSGVATQVGEGSRGEEVLAGRRAGRGGPEVLGELGDRAARLFTKKDDGEASTQEMEEEVPEAEEEAHKEVEAAAEDEYQSEEEPDEQEDVEDLVDQAEVKDSFDDEQADEDGVPTSVVPEDEDIPEAIQAEDEDADDAANCETEDDAVEEEEEVSEEQSCDEAETAADDQEENDMSEVFEEHAEAMETEEGEKVDEEAVAVNQDEDQDDISESEQAQAKEIMEQNQVADVDEVEAAEDEDDDDDLPGNEEAVDVVPPASSRTLATSKERRAQREANLERYLGLRDSTVRGVSGGATPKLQVTKPVPKKKPQPKAKAETTFPFKQTKFDFNRFSRFKLKQEAEPVLLDASEDFMEIAMERLRALAAARGAEKVQLCDIRRYMGECGFVPPVEQDPTQRILFGAIRETVKEEVVLQLIPMRR